MARPLRIEYEGALYHVFSRGNKKQDIFHFDDDRNVFLDTIGHMSERFDIEIFAYVLMNNHYHLLLRTPQGNLSKAMHWLGTTYTRRFNVNNDQVGHLFQDRFKSILVENDSYLIQLSYYIHRNPLRAGIVKRLIDYPWSSYPAYAYNRRHPNWLSKELILSQIGGKGKQLRYRERVQQYSDESRRVWEELRHGFIYGSQNFVDHIKERYVGGEPDPAIPQQRSLLKDQDPRQLLTRAAQILQCDLGQLKSAPRVTEGDQTNRDMLLYLLWQEGKNTNREIGLLLGLTHSSVSRRIAIMRERLERDRKLRRKFVELKSQIKP
jgi:REP element-mobilizing transposase RayT